MDGWMDAKEPRSFVYPEWVLSGGGGGVGLVDSHYFMNASLRACHSCLASPRLVLPCFLLPRNGAMMVRLVRAAANAFAYSLQKGGARGTELRQDWGREGRAVITDALHSVEVPGMIMPHISKSVCQDTLIKTTCNLIL